MATMDDWLAARCCCGACEGLPALPGPQRFYERSVCVLIVHAKLRSLAVPRPAVCAWRELEDRSLMAGNVTANVQSGVLVITGDTADNAITLNWVQATNTFQVLSARPTAPTRP